MNVVLYAPDMEPITIIDLSMRGIEMLKERRVVYMAAMPPIKMGEDRSNPVVEYKTVRIEAHRLHMRGVETMILIAHDDTNALLLKPSWLPGQRGEINRMKQTNDSLVAMLMSSLRGGLDR